MGEKIQLKKNTKWWTGLSAGDIANQVYVAARTLFPMPEWIAFEEFTLATGAYTRRIDLLAISIWGNTRVVCCELKASRADFQNEIRDPTKRERAMQLGTEFVFVMPAGMVEKDEIPEGCGLYEVQRNQRIRRVKNGHQRGAIDWTPAMFHEVIRRMAFKKDTTYQMFSNRQNGSAVFRQIFKAYEKDWTFDELIGLTATLHRGLKFSEHEILQSKMDYDQRVMNDVAIQKAIEIQFAVQECCPWGTANSRDDFKRWFEQNKTPRLSQFTMTGLERVADALETHSRGVRIQIEKIREEMSNG